MLNQESRERTLVGEVISTVELGGQICREFNVTRHGIHMEIELRGDGGDLTGRKLLLHLRSGDFHLRQREGDNARVFTVNDESQSGYWMKQPFPVMLVVRGPDGIVQWMEMRNALIQANTDRDKRVKEIVFNGERFDVMSVRNWRERILGNLWNPIEALTNIE